MSTTVQTAMPLDPPRTRKVSVWVRVDEMETPAHVEAEIIPRPSFVSVARKVAPGVVDVLEVETGGPPLVIHRARLVGTWGGCMRMQAKGTASIARICARLTEHAVWHASVEVNGARYDLPRDTAARWARLVELQALALGVTL
jgi:hypothetical protein